MLLGMGPTTVSNIALHENLVDQSLAGRGDQYALAHLSWHTEDCDLNVSQIYHEEYELMIGR